MIWINVEGTLQEATPTVMVKNRYSRPQTVALIDVEKKFRKRYRDNQSDDWKLSLQGVLVL